MDERLEQIEKRVRSLIAEITQRPKNVDFQEIEWVINKLEQLGYEVRRKRNGGHHMFYVGGERFGVVTHNPGEKQIKRCYVEEFLKAMDNLNLMDEE